MKAQLLSYLLESGICFGVLYFFYVSALQGNTFFNANRAYLLVAATLSWMIPLLTFEPDVPLIYGNPVMARLPRTITVMETQVAAEQYRIAPSDVVLWLYLAGVLFFGLRFAVRFSRLWWRVFVTDKKPFAGYWRMETHGRLPTFSFFNFLFWDGSQTLSQAEECQILRHEMVHIQEKHSCDVLYAELLKVVFWVNPAMHLLKKDLQTLHEYRADAVVSREFGNPAYTSILIASFFRQLECDFSHFFNQSSIRQRTAMLQKPASARLRLSAFVFALPLVGALLFAFTFQEPLMPQKPESFTTPTDTSKKEVTIAFAMTRDNRPMEFSVKKGLSVNDLPDLIQATAVPVNPGGKSTYKVTEWVIYLVNGSRPLTELRADSETADMQAFNAQVKPGMRLVFEVWEVVQLTPSGQIIYHVESATQRLNKGVVVGSTIASVQIF